MTNTDGPPRKGLRAMTRESVRDQVADQALRLFDENGFDETTVDDIALAVGISARSFFRYFPSKEDVVISDSRPLGRLVRDSAAARPRDEPIWSVLRHAFAPLEVATGAEVERGLRIMRVMMSTASLRARNLEKHITWGVLLEPIVVERLEGDPDTRRFRAQTLIHAALACLDVALAEWTHRRAAASVSQLLDEAFATVGR